MAYYDDDVDAEWKKSKASKLVASWFEYEVHDVESAKIDQFDIKQIYREQCQGRSAFKKFPWDPQLFKKRFEYILSRVQRVHWEAKAFVHDMALHGKDYSSTLSHPTSLKPVCARFIEKKGCRCENNAKYPIGNPRFCHHHQK